MKWNDHRNRLALRHFFDGDSHHSRDRLIEENGVWGTCVACPRDKGGNKEPQKCDFKDRSDHQIPPPEVRELAMLFRHDPELLRLVLEEKDRFEEELPLPKFYDSETAYRYYDFWVGDDTTYRTVKSDGEYGENLSIAWVGTPEQQGYVDIRTSEHPFAINWRKSVMKKEISRLKKQLKKLEGE